MFARRQKENGHPKYQAPAPPFREPTQEHPGKETSMRNKPDHGESSYRGLGRMRDRIAVVTGADSGIGRAVCLAFAREGADVAMVYEREHDDARETERLVREAGRRTLLMPGDLADAATCEQVIERAAKQFDRIDVLVNNAAYQGKSCERFEDIDRARVEWTFRVNILAMFSTVRAALPFMGAGGAIINVSSIQAYDPSPGILDYASTKGAIVTFSKGLSKSLIDRGIRVNVVAPGPVWTPLVVQSFSDEKIRHFGENTPMKRPAQPAELAPAFVFLACDESRYVNGEVLGVTGGRLLG